MARWLFLVSLVMLSGLHNSPQASDKPGLWMIAENGMDLCLDRSTVASHRIGRNVPYASPGTEENPTFAIEFKLNDLAADAFARLTIANVGKTLQYWFDGRLLSEGVVRTSILGGVVLIVVDSESEARAVAAEAEGYRCSSSDSA